MVNKLFLVLEMDSMLIYFPTYPKLSYILMVLLELPLWSKCLIEVPM